MSDFSRNPRYIKEQQEKDAKWKKLSEPEQKEKTFFDEYPQYKPLQLVDREDFSEEKWLKILYKIHGKPLKIDVQKEEPTENPSEHPLLNIPKTGEALTKREMKSLAYKIDEQYGKFWEANEENLEEKPFDWTKAIRINKSIEDVLKILESNKNPTED